MLAIPSWEDARNIWSDTTTFHLEQWTTVKFEDRLVEPNGTFQPKCYGTEDTRNNADTYPNPGLEIGDMTIEGPLEQWPPPSRARLLGDVDPQKGTVEGCPSNP